ncbi:MAG: right-handed parallel beta-helix repeat-containing protein [Deltaproteobacteria bacterium]|nr:right-handed parallel beta-helix repeat-containing protein [Deltaproteobacteria bacterium]
MANGNVTLTLVLVGLVLALAGCGGEEPATGGPSQADAGADAGAACAPGELPLDGGGCQPAGLPPDMPCPPGETLNEAGGCCPAGTMPLDDGSCRPAGIPPEMCGEGFEPDGSRGCEPILPAEPCPKGNGLMAIPGETKCREVAPCGSGTWGDIPVDDATQYVDAAYAGGDSDGSAERPWTSIQAGIDAAKPGGIVAVAAGTYAEDVLIKGKPVRLWGRCPGLVEVVGSGAALAAVFVKKGADESEIHSLGIRGEKCGILVSGSKQVQIDRVWIHDTAQRGLDVERALGPTSVTVKASLVETARELGVFVSGSDATIEATVVRDTQPDEKDLVGGRSIHIQDTDTGQRAAVTVRTSLIERNHEVGVCVLGSDASIEASVVRDTQSDAKGEWEFGRGISIERDPDTGERAEVAVRSSFIEMNRGVGVFVAGSDATIEASVVRDTQPHGDGRFGDGVVVVSKSASATALVIATRIENSARVALSNFGAKVTLGWNIFQCAVFDLEGEEYLGSAYSFNHLGGNVCGCPEATEECEMVSAEIEPPEPLPPLDPP